MNHDAVRLIQSCRVDFHPLAGSILAAAFSVIDDGKLHYSQQCCEYNYADKRLMNNFPFNSMSLLSDWDVARRGL
jgi:hypothetical protein